MSEQSLSGPPLPHLLPLFSPSHARCHPRYDPFPQWPLPLLLNLLSPSSIAYKQNICAKTTAVCVCSAQHMQAAKGRHLLQTAFPEFPAAPALDLSESSQAWKGDARAPAQDSPNASPATTPGLAHEAQHTEDSEATLSLAALPPPAHTASWPPEPQQPTGPGPAPTQQPMHEPAPATVTPQSPRKCGQAGPPIGQPGTTPHPVVEGSRSPSRARVALPASEPASGWPVAAGPRSSTSWAAVASPGHSGQQRCSDGAASSPLEPGSSVSVPRGRAGGISPQRPTVAYSDGHAAEVVEP